MKNDVKEIEPRSLTAREGGWIREILQANEEWRDADISRTQVVAEGPCDEGISFRLRAPEPENPKPVAREGSVGNVWIHTDDNCSINIQLSQWNGRLQEMYVLYIDPKHPRRTLPESWTEVSHEAHSM